MGLRTFLGLKKHKTPGLLGELSGQSNAPEILRLKPHTDDASTTELTLPFPLPNTGVEQSIGAIPFRSESCSSHHFYYSCYEKWCADIQEPPRFHRKQWEFVYILQTLWERGLLSAGKTGVGFGVGIEPLTALMVKNGCSVLATDLGGDEREAKAWAKTNQHSTKLSDLNDRGICPEDVFAKNAAFRPVDMNNIPDDITGYDFCWSACCFEHLGSIKAGLDFYRNSLKTLKPGGLAVHTTELNLSSDTVTLESGSTVLFRKSDIKGLIEGLEADGHTCEPLLIHEGSQPIDNFIDIPTYSSDRHLRLALGNYATTSIGIITRKAG